MRSGSVRRLLALAALVAALSMASNAASAACLRKSVNLQGSAPTSSFVMVPETEVAEYTSQGFARIDCPSDPEARRQLVKRICEAPLRSPNPAIANDPKFAEVRERACASARAALAESGG